MKLDKFCAADKENDYGELQKSTKEDIWHIIGTVHSWNTPAIPHWQMDGKHII